MASVTPELQKAQDILSAVIAQRDQAMNGMVQLQAANTALTREIEELKNPK